jgi:PPOX class probable F420-dependent enzyme
MSEIEAREFLSQSRSTLILGTVNSDGSPLIHPVWFYFDPSKTKLYFYTEPTLRKAANIRERSQVYFDVDDDRWPYKGVKGKGRARFVESKEDSLALASKILAKYVKKGQPMTGSVLEKVRTGGYVVIEITPAYFTSWNYGKLDPKGDRGLRDAVVAL